MADAFKPDTFKLQELVALGVPMKPRVRDPIDDLPEGEPIGPNETIEERTAVADNQKSAERAKRKGTPPKENYESLFLKVYEFKDRKSIYISKEMHQKIAHIAGILKDRELSVGAYIENIVNHHFDLYKDEINALYVCKTQKPL